MLQFGLGKVVAFHVWPIVSFTVLLLFILHLAGQISAGLEGCACVLSQVKLPIAQYSLASHVAEL